MKIEMGIAGTVDLDVYTRELRDYMREILNSPNREIYRSASAVVPNTTGRETAYVGTLNIQVHRSPGVVRRMRGMPADIKAYIIVDFHGEGRTSPVMYQILENLVGSSLDWDKSGVPVVRNPHQRDQWPSFLANTVEAEDIPEMVFEYYIEQICGREDTW